MTLIVQMVVLKRSMAKMHVKVCILTAGRGTRLGEYSQAINKALLPLEGKAIISHIINKFPTDSGFIIAVGYKAEQVKNYLQIVHPLHKFNFVNVENFDGPGSGPGLSVLACKNHLNSPFYFISCDTLWSEDIKSFPTDVNWIAVEDVSPEATINYCNVVSKASKVIEIQDKTIIQNKTSSAFSGLAFIYNSDDFWKGLETVNSSGNEKQVSDGLLSLMNKDSLYVQKINWTDVGTKEKYINQVKKSENYDFSKTNEFFYAVDGRIIKFFQDESIAERRVKKSRLNSAVFPVVKEHRGGFYSYDYQSGETLYKFADPKLFNLLIQWLDQNLWMKRNIASEVMYNMCQDFYQKKTYDRLIQYEKKYPQHNILTINNLCTPSVRQLLDSINWQALFKGEAYFIHGDLQPDNIIFNKSTNNFTLLDWRQDFAGEIDYGDIYYDFAKLWAGLYLNYDQIKQNKFSYNERATSCEFYFPSHSCAQEAQIILEDFVKLKNFDVQKVKLLVGLIYLNMSPLHHYPFDKMLHALGRQMLNAAIQGSFCDK